jgi:predicted kinase
VLLVINGAPGVGKSTLARRYADEHPLALVIDIDMIRTHLGRWVERDESKLVARDLAVALTRAHLLGGYDVVVAQYLGRPEFIERLALVATEVGTPFVEVLLSDDTDAIIERFRRRRAEYEREGLEHPELELEADAIAAELPLAHERLLRDAGSRAALVVSAEDGPEAVYRSLCRALDNR